MNLGREWAARIQHMGRGNMFNKHAHFIKRWPINPKIAIYGPPNSFVDEISMRYVIITLILIHLSSFLDSLLIWEFQSCQCHN